MLIAAVILASPVPAEQNRAVHAGRLGNPLLRECSGMDASTRRPDLLWAVNDGGNGAWLYAMGPDGRDRGRVRVDGAKNRDWEAMDAFRWAGDSYLLIADVGDNQAKYPYLTLYVLPEPEMAEGGAVAPRAVSVAWRIDFVYPDGPRDAEAVAVDVATETVVVVAKRERRPSVYTLPLSATAAGGPVVAEKIGAIGHLPPPTIEDLLHPYGAFRSQPTALDISPDGGRAVLLTYKNAYRFTRPPEVSWAAALLAPGVSLPLPRPETAEDLRQRESICFSGDGETILVTSEGIGAGIYAVRPEP